MTPRAESETSKFWQPCKLWNKVWSFLGSGSEIYHPSLLVPGQFLPSKTEDLLLAIPLQKSHSAQDLQMRLLGSVILLTSAFKLRLQIAHRKKKNSGLVLSVDFSLKRSPTKERHCQDHGVDGLQGRFGSRSSWLQAWANKVLYRKEAPCCEKLLQRQCPTTLPFIQLSPWSNLADLTTATWIWKKVLKCVGSGWPETKFFSAKMNK